MEITEIVGKLYGMTEREHVVQRKVHEFGHDQNSGDQNGYSYETCAAQNRNGIDYDITVLCMRRPCGASIQANAASMARVPITIITESWK